MSSSIFNSKTLTFFMSFLFSSSSLVLYNLNNVDQRISLLLERKRFWLNKTYAPSSFDGVIIGDSRVYRGINPALFQEEGIGKFLNFGYSSAGLSPNLIESAKSKLSPQKRNVIILGITPHSLTKEAFKNDHFGSFQNFSKDSQFFYLSKILPLAFAPLDAEGDYINKNYIESYKENGWVASDYKERKPQHALKSYNDNYDKYQVNNELINHLIKNKKKYKDYKKFAFWMPSTQEMDQLELKKGRFAPELVKVTMEKAGFKWIPIPFRSKLISYDGSHLTSDSANRLSRFIAKEVRLAIEKK